MRRFILDFVRRGVVACGFGPLVLVVLYAALSHHGVVQMLSVGQVCTGIFSLTALAFIAGGMNALYQLERLPLMVAILIHGTVLYFSYLLTYLLNDWLEWSAVSLLVFSGIFVVGYLVIWMIIYLVIKRRTARLNELLQTDRQNADT